MNTANITLRAARIQDKEMITDFNTRMALETEEKALDRATLLKGVQALLEDPLKGRYYLAEDGSGTPVGQLMVTYEWSDWRNENIWWIQSVFVTENMRGKGIYKALYAKVCEDALAAGTQTIRLYVERNNTVAQQVYEKLGMTETVYKLYEISL